MKKFASIFLLLAFNVLNDCAGRPDSDCPATCSNCKGHMSPVAQVVGYAYKSEPGFQYAMVGFGNHIAALVNVAVNFQSGKILQLIVNEIVGYFVELPAKYKLSDGKYKYKSKLWFIYDPTNACPEIYEIESSPYGGTHCFNKAAGPLPIAASLAFKGYYELYASFDCQCNRFPSTVPCGCDESSIATIDLKNLNCAYFSSLSNHSVEKYANTYGVSGINIAQAPQSSPLLYTETVTASGFDTTPHCRDFTNTASIYDIVASYNYHPNCLDRYSRSKVATLYAQGFNPGKCQSYGESSSCRGTGSITDYCAILLFASQGSAINYGSPAQSPAEIIYIRFNGYCLYSLMEAILRYFLY